MYKKFGYIFIICLMLSGCSKETQGFQFLELGELTEDNLSKVEFERIPHSNIQPANILEVEDLDEFIDITDAAVRLMRGNSKVDEDFLIEKLSPRMLPNNVQYFLGVLGSFEFSNESLFVPAAVGSDVLLSDMYKEQLVRLKEHYRISTANAETLEELVTEFLADSIEGMEEEKIEEMRSWARDVLDVEFDEMPEDLAALGLTVEELELLIQETLEQEAEVDRQNFESLRVLAETDSRFILKDDGIYVNVSELTEEITVEYNGFEYYIEPVPNVVNITSDTDLELVSCRGALNRVIARYADIDQGIYCDFKFKVSDDGIENVDIRVSPIEPRLEIERGVISSIGNFVVNTLDDERIISSLEKVFSDHLSKSTVVDVTESISDFIGEWDSWGDRELILTAYLLGELDPHVQVVGDSLQEVKAYVDLVEIFEKNSIPRISVGNDVAYVGVVPSIWNELQFFTSEVELVAYNLFDNGFFRVNYEVSESDTEFNNALEIRMFININTGEITNYEYIFK